MVLDVHQDAILDLLQNLELLFYRADCIQLLEIHDGPDERVGAALAAVLLPHLKVGRLLVPKHLEGPLPEALDEFGVDEFPLASFSNEGGGEPFQESSIDIHLLLLEEDEEGLEDVVEGLGDEADEGLDDELY